MHRSNDFWSHFTILLFKEGINKSMKNDEEFWSVFRPSFVNLKLYMGI